MLDNRAKDGWEGWLLLADGITWSEKGGAWQYPRAIDDTILRKCRLSGLNAPLLMALLPRT